MSESYGWKNYEQSSPEIRKQILDELDRTLPTMTGKQIVAEFTGAPGDVILLFIIDMPWQVQVEVYKHCLPIGAYDAVGRILDAKAKEKLGLKPKRKNNCLA